MKILYLGSFTESWSTENYVSRALERAGVQVVRIEQRTTTFDSLPTIVRAEAAKGTIDTFLFAKAAMGGVWDTTPFKLIEALRHVRPHVGAPPRTGYCVAPRIVCWIFDLLNPAYNSERYQWASAVSEVTELFLTTDGSMQPYLTRAKTLRQGVPDDVRPGVVRKELECDILFLGGLYGKRREWIEPLQDHFHHRLWVVERGLRGDILNDVMVSAKVVLGPNWPMYPGYCSNRCFVVTGYGGLYLSPKTEGLDDLYETMAYPVYEPGQEIRMIERCLTNMPMRKFFDERSQKMALAHHTYDHRVKQLIEWIT